MTIKYLVNGNPVPKEQLLFVRPVKITRNIMQGGMATEEIRYEPVPDTEVLQDMIRFMEARD